MERVLEYQGNDHEYKVASERGDVCGRYYNINGTQRLSREVRQRVKEDYDRLDADSCHPNCIIILCRMLGIEVPGVLVDYI